MYALGEHAKAAGNLGKVTARNGGRGLVADTELKMRQHLEFTSSRSTHLEASRAPVDELDGALGLDAGNSSLGIFGNNVATVEQAASH